MGILRVDFRDPSFELPVTLRHPGGVLDVTGGRDEVQLPAGDPELTPIRVGPRQVWILIAAGRVAQLGAHPCCFLNYNGTAYDDALAVCGTPTCPDGTEQVPHALAEDPICGARPRCVPPPQVRFVRDGAPATILQDELGASYSAAPRETAAYQRVRTNIAEMLVVSVVRSDGGLASPHWIALDHGARYTVRIAAGDIVGVTRD
jgi:hypothetical protein